MAMATVPILKIPIYRNSPDEPFAECVRMPDDGSDQTELIKEMLFNRFKDVRTPPRERPHTADVYSESGQLLRRFRIAPDRLGEPVAIEMRLDV